MFRIRFHYDADPDPRLHWTKFGLKGSNCTENERSSYTFKFFTYKQKISGIDFISALFYLLNLIYNLGSIIWIRAYPDEPKH